MKDQPILRDERTNMVENTSYRWGYLVATYGLLIIVIIRAFVFKQSNWDLMALVVFSGLITTAYQAYHQIYTRRWIYIFAATIFIAALVAGLVAFVIK